MNYFELYPGDYLRDTGELTLAQHGAYLLLLMSYFSTENGLPTDRIGLCRITSAMTREEQSATMVVAARFFIECDGRLRSARIDQDIEKARIRIDAARSNGSKGGRPKKPNANPTHNPEETQQEPTGFPMGSNPVNPDAKLNGTQKKAHHTPDPNYSVGRSEASAEISTAQPTEAGRACQLLKQAGCVRFNPSHPDLLAALREGVTPDAIRDAYLESPDKKNPFAYAIATARSRHAEGAKPISTGPPSLRVQAAAPMSKTLQALHHLEAAKHAPGLDNPGNQLRIAKADPVEP